MKIILLTLQIAILFELILTSSALTRNEVLERFLSPYRLIKTFIFTLLRNTEQTENNFRLLKLHEKLQSPVPDSQKFPCNLENTRSKTPPNSVHKLRPGDIDVIGAIGDSLTGAVGAFATNPFQIIVENRGVSPTVGGEKSWREYLTIPNILKVFNPNLIGYSTRTSITLERNSQLNVAETGAVTDDMLYMTQIFLKRLLANPLINMTHHWKMVTIFYGANDFCYEICLKANLTLYLEKHRNDLLQILRLLRNNSPRTFVNVVPAPSVKILVELVNKSGLCNLMNLFQCPCFFGQFSKYRSKFYDFMTKWQEVDQEVAQADEFDSDDFTVVFQPSSINYFMPKTVDGSTDFTHMSLDCFHMSQKGYARMANIAWNNILEPVGNKSTNHITKLFELFRCPTETSPYLYTRRNSL